MKIQQFKINLVRDGEITLDNFTAPDVENFADLLHSFIGESDVENFVVICLNAVGNPIGISTVSIGTVNATMVHPRDVFKRAIVSNSVAIVVGHNHPSGNARPSLADIELTKLLIDGGQILGIQVVDHLIITQNMEYYSFSKNNLMKGTR